MSKDNSTTTYESGNPYKDVTIEEAGSGIFQISGDLGEFLKITKKNLKMITIILHYCNIYLKILEED